MPSRGLVRLVDLKESAARASRSVVKKYAKHSDVVKHTRPRNKWRTEPVTGKEIQSTLPCQLTFYLSESVHLTD